MSPRVTFVTFVAPVDRYFVLLQSPIGSDRNTVAFWLEVYKRGRVTELYTPYGVCFTGYEDTGNPKIVTSPPVGCLEDVRKKLDV